MSDPTITPVPDLAVSVVRALAQKGLTALATGMTGYGMITSDQQAHVVALGLSVALWATSFVWTYLHEKHAKARVVEALNTPSPAQ